MDDHTKLEWIKEAINDYRYGVLTKGACLEAINIIVNCDNIITKEDIDLTNKLLNQKCEK